MEFDALTMISAAQQLQHQLSMCYLRYRSGFKTCSQVGFDGFFRGLFHLVKVLHLMVLSCTVFCLATCGPCLIDGMQKSMQHDDCKSYKDDHAAGFQDIIVSDASAGYDVGSPISHISIKNICTNSHSFCFSSTLPGFSSKEHKSEAEVLEVSSSQSDNLSSIGSIQGSKGASNGSWFSDSGMFELINGQTLSCSLNSMEGPNEFSTMQTSSADKNDLSSCRGALIINRSTSLRLNMYSEMRKSSPFDVSASPYVEISPPVLDYGHRHLYFPSVAFLTVTNMCNDSILHVYEPFSTNIQFYPCNFIELFIGPGETASICFEFLPRWLGLSSAHLILQTSSGGFLVQVKGYAVESPYKISAVVSLDTDYGGQLIKNLSLFNPFNENLYIREISAWILLSQGNISYHAEATCSTEKFQDSDGLSLLSVKDWLVVNSGQGFPLMAIRPHENWEIDPHGSETVIEIEFSFESEAQIVGAFCMQLMSSSHDKADTILVPFEIDLDGKFANNGMGVSGSVSVSLEAVLPCDTSNTVVAISLRNGAPHLLSVVKISEVAPMKVFVIKYVQGLLLFPGTVTQVATITCTQLLVDLHDSSPETSNVNENCKLVVLTNDSSIPQIEIPCQNVARVCLRHQEDSSIGFDFQSEKAESGYRRSGSLSSFVQLPSKISVLKTIEADEFVLENWKSQGTSRNMSVLDDHEVLFPVVQVGTQQSKWITVKNPSEWPVIMQLILNSAEIIDECRGRDVFLQPLSFSSLVQSDFTIRYGFSVADGARTEAYVHPYGEASFGPIFFHPSNRCGWTSTALIRNNLSGVEWLSLKGYGGSLSLALFEGSEPVQSIEFNLNLPFPLNISPPDLLFHMEETIRACSQPLSKEVYAKNMGDLPVEVKSIEVSGTECGLDGFTVHNCNGFLLEPGESVKLLISYQTDFYAAMLQRDLELALASGILVIPMKASLPLHVFNACKKSVFWMRLKKFSPVVLLSASLMFLIFYCIFPQVINLGSQDYSYKGEKSSISTVRSLGKSACLHRNQRSSKFSVPSEVEGLLKSVEGKTSTKTSGLKYPDSQVEEPISVQDGMPTPENHKVAPSLLSKTVAVENSNALEASEPHSLTVRIGKEKGRRRKKRKSVTAGLSGLFEVSSSQSGNSTPSSPLSPTSSVTSNRNWSPSPDVDAIEVRSSFTEIADRQCAKVHMAERTTKPMVSESKVSIEYVGNDRSSDTPRQPSLARKSSIKPVFLTSATFRSAGKAASNLLYSSPASASASTSTMAPHARAPGPKLYDQKKVQEKVGNEYTYDIWGDHFSGLHLVGRSKDVTTMKTVATENSSNSFFVRGPQALMTKTQPKYASCFHDEG